MQGKLVMSGIECSKIQTDKVKVDCCPVPDFETDILTCKKVINQKCAELQSF